MSQHKPDVFPAPALTGADLPAATTSVAGAAVLATPSSDVTAGHVVQANDARMSDARTPTAHTHVEGDLSTTDITTANATTSKHGFVPKLPNDATKYYDGTGAYSVPAGASVADTSASVYNSAAQSISNATPTIATFDSETWDTASIHSTSSNTSRLTAPSTGKYLVIGPVLWASNATGTRTAEILKNGSTVLETVDVGALSTADDMPPVAVLANLTAGDYVELRLTQTSLGSLNATATFQMALIGTGGFANPMTTKGDLIAAAASGVATRLPVGTDGQALVADSTQTLGVKWDTSSGYTLDSWAAATFQNSATNYDTSSFTAGAYRKDSAGHIFLRGLIKPGSSTSVIFTLPSGYRPTRGLLFSVQGGGDSGSGVVRVDVAASGTVTVGTLVGGSNPFVDLNVIHFFTDS